MNVDPGRKKLPLGTGGKGAEVIYWRTSPVLSYYASPSSAEAYSDRQQTPNFEL